MPLGTYRPGLEVDTVEADGVLTISLDGKIIAVHTISSGTGQLIQKSSHRRDNTSNITVFMQKVLNLLGGSEEAKEFLSLVQKDKPRYIRDQLGLLERTLRAYPADAVHRAIQYCLERQLYSAVDCRDAVIYLLNSQAEMPLASAATGELPLEFRVKAEVRSIAAYSSLCGGGSDE